MVDYLKACKCAILSKEVYQAFSSFRASTFPGTTPHFINQPKTDAQCVMLLEEQTSSAYIAFRGGEGFADWDTNLDFRQEVVEFQQDVIDEQVNQQREQVYPYAGESSSGAQMHRGFVTAYMSIRENIHDFLSECNAENVVLTGHSLGGPLATLCAVDIEYNFPNFLVEVYTFGAPKVGNAGFKASFNRRVPKSYRFVYGMDIVSTLPRVWQGYHHVDKEYRLGKPFSLNFLSQRFKDHEIAKYIVALKELSAKQGS